MKGEINLLPAGMVRERRRVLYWARGRGLLRTALALASLMAVGQFNVLAFYYSLARTGEAGMMVQSAAGRDLQREVADSNRLLSAIQSQARRQVIWSERISEVLALMQTLQVRELRGDEQSGTLIIEGTSSSSAAVATLQQALEGLSWAQRVEAPLTNFAIKPGAAFTLMVVGKKL